MTISELDDLASLLAELISSLPDGQTRDVFLDAANVLEEMLEDEDELDGY